MRISRAFIVPSTMYTKWSRNSFQIGFLKVLKGSYMEEMKQKYGLLSQSKPPYEVLRTNWLSYEE